MAGSNAVDVPDQKVTWHLVARITNRFPRTCMPGKPEARNSKPCNDRLQLCSTFFNDAELMQNRKPDGLGPSGNTCPRCASQTLQSTSMRVIPQEVSLWYWITLSFTGSVKLGHPERELNFWVLSKRCVPQQIQPYTPATNSSQYSPVKACSVPCSRVMWNCSGVSCAFHSSFVFITFRSGSRFA